MVDAANLPPDYAANAPVDLVEIDADSPPPAPPMLPPPPPPPPHPINQSSPSSSTATTISSHTSSSSSPSSHQQEDDDGRVFLVPYRWFRETQEQESSSSSSSNSSSSEARGILYSASPVNYVGPMKIINNFFNSDLVFHLQRTDDGYSDDHTLSSVSASARYYALIRTDLWSHALKWHGQHDLLEETTKSSFTGDTSKDVYAVTLKISVVREPQKMAVKISKRDNTIEYFKRASKIFSVESEPIYIWDFSGQTTLIFMNETNKLHRDVQQQSDQEIMLVLYIYALSEFSLSQDGKKDDSGTPSHKKFLSPGSLLLCNGSSKTIGDSDSISDNAVALNGRSHKVEYLGMTGLENLGNTCFMNSAIQCLAHTPKLVDYFLGNYRKEINYDNPLGMRGELALAFGELLRKLWAPDRTPVIPRLFKTKLSHFATQFSGFNQHDSQELLAFLLDGLHEDLNRVKRKPYVEVKDGLDRPDEEVADEYWANHLARNDSIIVDMCQGQYKSKLVCPTCNKLSVTFDPFMYLSLPLPTTSMRSMTLTVFSSDGIAKPFPCTVTIPKYGNCRDLIHSLSNACSLKDDESLLVGEVYSNQVIRCLDEPSDSLSLIRDGDQLVTYRLPKDLDSSPLVVFTHQHMDEQDNKTQYSHSKTFVPLVTRLPGICNGPMISNLYMKLLSPFLTFDHDQDDAKGMSSTKVTSMDMNPLVFDCATPIGANATTANNDHILSEVKFHIIDERGVKIEFEIEKNEEVSIPGKDKRLHIIVCWPQNSIEKYGKSLFISLPEVHKSKLFFTKRPPNSISLYACLDAFLKEEPLGPEDMWYCPSCKVHRQASKKLDLWRLPEFLVIHLKRFSYNRSMENKLESFVDFPIHDLDLSNYIGSHNDKEQQSICYELFAISNHYGTMRGGHYTAYVFHAGNQQWLDFDDRHVSCISEDSVKTSAAYVLFYKRVSR